jgi:hypothetical protein
MAVEGLRILEENRMVVERSAMLGTLALPLT